MALCSRLTEQGFGAGQILRNAPAQLVGLTEVEFGIGIALGGGAFPFMHGGGEIALAPGIHASLDVGQHRGACPQSHAQRHDGAGNGGQQPAARSGGAGPVRAGSNDHLINLPCRAGAGPCTITRRRRPGISPGDRHSPDNDRAKMVSKTFPRDRLNLRNDSRG